MFSFQKTLFKVCAIAMRYSSQVKPETQETLALLKILALGDQDIRVGKTRPVADVVARLRAKLP